VIRKPIYAKQRTSSKIEKSDDNEGASLRCTLRKGRTEMKLLAATVASLTLMASPLAQADQTKASPKSNAPSPTLTFDDIRMVAPALEKYKQGALLGDLWKRPALSPRDRSIITAAALIARNQTNRDAALLQSGAR
jgi:alkylhydroperoxidase/carboxymuconolactone decarboxylase family protein YurZ